MRQEPELAHPFNRRPSTASVTSTSSKVSSKEKAHAKSLRNAGKEVCTAVLRSRHGLLEGDARFERCTPNGADDAVGVTYVQVIVQNPYGAVFVCFVLVFCFPQKMVRGCTS